MRMLRCFTHDDCAPLSRVGMHQDVEIHACRHVASIQSVILRPEHRLRALLRPEGAICSRAAVNRQAAIAGISER
jgi:hypothetical protein